MENASRLTIGRETILCMSLAGRPGTFGSRFHNHLYAALGLDYVYKAFSTQDLPAAIAGIRALGVRGCAISMPFKEACIPLLDALAPSASAIESVNTIVNDAGKLTGHNTDYAAIAPLLQGIDTDTPFALHGSGGMAKAVAAALRDHGYTRGTIVARNEQTGRALARACGFGYQVTLQEHPRMLINVTPVGMAGPNADELPFPSDAIDAAELAFDVVALPVETPFVRRARSLGKRVITGGQVIALQAVGQFVLYTGITPSDAQVAAAQAYALSPG
ncbi:MAG TPA: shikimate 5-dehydrogenase [Polyangiales bacterium]|nr:shikimate 5-dehydrogenase [Polyangiales bacterium]